MSRKRKWPTGIVKFDVPIYGGTVVFVQSYKKWRQCVRHLTGKKPTEMPDGVGCSTAYHAPMATFYFVGVFVPQAAILVHELAHITFTILDDVSVPLGNGNEAYCYLLDTLFATIRHEVKLK